MIHPPNAPVPVHVARCPGILATLVRNLIPAVRSGPKFAFR